MFIRDYLLIDTEDGEDILDLQSEKGGAQRTGVCRKLRMPKSAPLRGFVLVRPKPFTCKQDMYPELSMSTYLIMNFTTFCYSKNKSPIHEQNCPKDWWITVE